MEELLPKLTSAKVFSVADAKNKFWQVQLNEESSFLTTLGNTWGRYRWTRMPFGIFLQNNSAKRIPEKIYPGFGGSDGPRVWCG